MQELLDLAHDAPRRTLQAAERLVEQGTAVGALFVLLDGEVHVERAGVRVASIREPGSCIGEMSLLLGVPATADVVAARPSTVAVIENAAAALARDDGLSLPLARVLARRVQAMTTYLVDLKQQYADHEGGLGMVDVVLDRLLQGPGRPTELRSARDPDPEY